MISIPPRPVPRDDREVGRVTMPLRYEDVAQDGRMMLEAMPPALGEAIWRTQLTRTPAARLARAQGIVPILSRMIVTREAGPISVNAAVEADGTWELAHTVDDRGEVDRLILNLWADVFAPLGRTYGPPPDGAGARVRVGRVYAEHVFTRLFAPPNERKVVAFAFEGLPSVPEARHAWKPPSELLRAPADARAIAGERDDAEALEEEPTPVVFGLAHTDSNQHVNSLAYPRLFEEHVLRRLHARGRDPRVLSSAYEIAFRKPCFAGDVATVALRVFEHGSTTGAVGVFSSPSAPRARPHCWVRMTLA